MKHLFIVNPVAGGTDKTEFVAAKVAECFSGKEGSFEIYTTRAPMDACDKILHEAELCDELRVYACGGDGTLNECVCAAAEVDNVAVTCFPTGTGNDFIKTFGEEKNRFFNLDELVSGEVRSIDLMRCNDRYCLNICSVGIDARIGTQVHNYSHLPVIGGATGYVVSMVANFIKGIKDELRIVCQDKLYYGDINLVCVCNGTHYGGGFNPVPEARPDDGIMDVLIVKGVSRARFVSMVMKYAKGGYAELPQYISHVRTRHLEIASEQEVVVNLDGEAIYGKDICIDLIPGGIKFIVPSQMAFFENAPEKTEATAQK
jgi:YegS/Rv2252/BmrU family lipid kinase